MILNPSLIIVSALMGPKSGLIDSGVMVTSTSSKKQENEDFLEFWEVEVENYQFPMNRNDPTGHLAFPKSKRKNPCPYPASLPDLPIRKIICVPSSLRTPSVTF